MCLPDGLRLNVVLDSLLYYGMLCTLPIWLYPIGRVIRKSLNHNKLLGVLVIILSSVVVLVGGFIALLVFTFSGPRSVWYKDKTHVITEGYALSKYSFFVYDRGGIVDKVKYKGSTGDSPVIPDSAQWKFYDQWGVLMAWSDNKLDKARGMKAYSLFVIDSLLYNRHQKEILNLRKSYLAKEQNYILKGFLSYGGSIPAYIFRYNTKTRIITVSEWDGYYLESNRIKLSKEANDSVITLIRQHPEALVRDGKHCDRYGKGKMCSSLEVNNRTIFDCVGSDFSHMPAPFRDIMRLFASKDVQGNELLLSLDKSR